jgi:hypothetical protein
MSESKRKLYEALMRRGYYEVVEETVRPNQLRLLGRVGKDRTAYLLPVMSVLYDASESPDFNWTIDMSKYHFKDQGGAFRWAWRFIFQSKASIDSCYESIIQVILSAPRPERVEVSSVPLPGYNPNKVRGGQNTRGKGAAAIGEAKTGPMGIALLNRGGH